MRSFKSIIERYSQLYNSLRFIDFVKYNANKLSSKLLNPDAQLSYSQFGEDLIIQTFFQSQKSGTYIDVGCNEPINYSNTWKLYLSGWTGIAIDANPSLTEKFKKVRPLDTVVAKPISNKKQIIEFYFSKKSHLISGIGEKRDSPWSRTDENCDVIECESERLDNILLEHNIPSDFDFLNIDTEGNEKDILISLDLNKFKPKLICVEIHDFTISTSEKSDIEELLSSMGYYIVAFSKPSIFFARKSND